MSTATNTATVPTNEASELRDCQCGNYSDAVTGTRLDCDGQTYRNFAPGHDARLKGFLIRTGREGHEIKVLGTRKPISPVEAASTYGFAGMVADGIARRPRQRVAATVENGGTPATATTAKVGRWTYEGEIRKEGDIDWFHYRDGRGSLRKTQDFAEV